MEFADGRRANLFKGYNVESLYAAYALSFYNNTGFAYVTLPGGEIIMRSLHPASNKTFTSLFDIINGNGNQPEVIESFRDSLRNGKTGVAVFNDADGENVFCYVPMPDLEGWYLVSIIPNAVIMKEANAIILRTLFLCGLLFAGLLAVFFIYRRLKRGYQREIRALAFTDTLTGIRNFTKFKIDGDTLLQAPGAPRYAVLALDILNFQVVNEVLGYNIGDALLQRLALLLGESGPPRRAHGARERGPFRGSASLRQKAGTDGLLRRAAACTQWIRAFPGRELPYRAAHGHLLRGGPATRPPASTICWTAPISPSRPSRPKARRPGTSMIPACASGSCAKRNWKCAWPGPA